MAKKSPKRAPIGPGVTVCQGCCCARGADNRQDPETLVRHEHVRERVESVGGRFTVADCLGPCERRDVVVVRPGATGKERGGVPVWIGEVFTEDTLLAVSEWITAGGPGVLDTPPELRTHEFRPTRRNRADFERGEGCCT